MDICLHGSTDPEKRGLENGNLCLSFMLYPEHFPLPCPKTLSVFTRFSENLVKFPFLIITTGIGSLGKLRKQNLKLKEKKSPKAKIKQNSFIPSQNFSLIKVYITTSIPPLKDRQYA